MSEDGAVSTANPVDTVGAARSVAGRLSRLADQVAASGADAVILSPGADLAYLAGHSVGSHERLTALLVPASGTARMLVPTLERPGWSGTALEDLNIEFDTWNDGADPYRVVADLLPDHVRVLAVDDHMPAVHALGIRDAVVGADLRTGGALIAELRMRKSADEINSLAEIGLANDRVQQAISTWLRPGRTEFEVAADITDALITQGHARADFVIVGSGPNGASPHHEASDRVIQPGDPVVIDIGGPAADGYFSDCTRTYLMADGSPDPEFAKVYELVRAAQQAGIDAVRPGVPCEDIDRAAREVIEKAGYGEFFITRTGHGIGLEVHEHPYMVSGNALPLEPGMAFSVEPGIYLPGRFGVRIEDVVVCGESGPIVLNNAPKHLITVGG